MLLSSQQNPHALAQLRVDILEAQELYLQTYLIEPHFFAELFSDFLRRHTIMLLTDNRQRAAASALTATYPKLKARSWSANRTMHTKMILCWPTETSWVGSHNLTRGSWTLSENISIRVAHQPFFQDLKKNFTTTWHVSKPITPQG